MLHREAEKRAMRAKKVAAILPIALTLSSPVAAAEAFSVFSANALVPGCRQVAAAHLVDGL
jgi:hypothetical protein